MEIAKEKGPYSSYVGSPISNGKFQFDLWNVKPSDMWNWDVLREKVKKQTTQGHYQFEFYYLFSFIVFLYRYKFYTKNFI